MTSEAKTWEAFPYQTRIADIAFNVLKEHGLVYLAMEERTGKSITGLLVCEKTSLDLPWLILTKKKALDGWQETLTRFAHKKTYILANYHKAKNMKGKYAGVILDEAHSYISGYPKRSAMWKAVEKVTKGLPIIYMSATPHAQGSQLLFNQFALSSWSPWKKFVDYYEWFKHFAQRNKDGELPMKRISAFQMAMDYTAVKHDEVLAQVKHLFISYTRKELGFEQEPEDELHFIELSEPIKHIYNTLVKQKLLSFTLGENDKDYLLVCDSAAKLRWALHMLEGGTLKVNDEHVNLGNNEKVDYILNKWGDTSDVAIMYHFTADAIKLKKYFKNAGLFQGISNAEGVDLSHYKHLIIYSQDHSTAKHTQRRARQANKHRTEEIKVHYLLVKNAISHKAYKTVSINKQNFVDTVFDTI